MLWENYMWFHPDMTPGPYSNNYTFIEWKGWRFFPTLTSDVGVIFDFFITFTSDETVETPIFAYD